MITATRRRLVNPLSRDGGVAMLRLAAYAEVNEGEDVLNISDLMTMTLDIDASFIESALEGMSQDDLAKSPDPNSNNMGWLLWHKVRAEDMLISKLRDANQVFTDGAWHDKLGPSNDAANVGQGQQPGEASAFRVKEIGALKEYCSAVRKSTKEFLATMTEADLNREIEHPSRGMQPALFFLAALLLDGLHHSGQFCYLRGHYKGFGWARA